MKYGKEPSGLGLVACYDAAEKEELEGLESPLKNYTMNEDDDFDVNTPGRILYASEPAVPWSSPNKNYPLSQQKKGYTNVQRLFPMPPQAAEASSNDDTNFSDLGFEFESGSHMPPPP